MEDWWRDVLRIDPLTTIRNSDGSLTLSIALPTDASEGHNATVQYVAGRPAANPAEDSGITWFIDYLTNVRALRRDLSICLCRTPFALLYALLPWCTPTSSISSLLSTQSGQQFLHDIVEFVLAGLGRQPPCAVLQCPRHTEHYWRAHYG